MAEFMRVLQFFFLFVFFALVRIDAEEIKVLYKRVGDTVTLLCANVHQGYPNCSSTTWRYSRDRTETQEIVTLGKSKDILDPNMSSRRTLDSHCSLTVRRVEAGDAGLYNCQQWTSADKTFPVSSNRLFLSVLSAMRPEQMVSGSFFLSCKLYNYEGKCQDETLSWIDETGFVKQNNLRTKDYTCLTNLQMDKPKKDAVFKCQLTVRGEMETFVDVTLKGTKPKPEEEILTSSQTVLAVTEPMTNPASEMLSLHKHIILGVASAVGVLTLFLLAVLISKRKKAARDHQPTTDKVALPLIKNADPEMIQSNLLSTSKDPDGGLTYASINHSNRRKVPSEERSMDCSNSDMDDRVTQTDMKYPSAGGGRNHVDSSNVYATVKMQGM